MKYSMDLEKLREKNYKPIKDYVTNIMQLEDKKSQLLNIAFEPNQKDKEIALEEYKEKFGADYYYYFVKGEYFLRFSGKHQDSEYSYTEAIRLKPDYADAYNNRGYEYNKQRKYKKAIEDFNEAIRLKPDHAVAFNNRGFAYEKQKRYEEAIKDYTKTISIDSDNAVAFNNRGAVYLAQKNYEEAIKDQNKAIRLKPGYAAAFNNRGLVYLNKKNSGRKR